MGGIPAAGLPSADGRGVTVLYGGPDSDSPPPRHGGSAGSSASRDGSAAPAGGRGSAAAQRPQRRFGRPDAATDPWPGWAHAQLRSAVSIANRCSATTRSTGLAGELYRRWFNPVIAPAIDFGRLRVPLAGLYRTAHAGSASRVVLDGVSVVGRQDVVGRDGWWRTWGEAWLPTRSRTNAVRIMLSPHPEALAGFVRTVTGALLEERVPWLLACPTDVQRLRRPASAVLYVPGPEALPRGLLAEVAPLLRSVTPPLCLPLAPGVALAEYPDNGMSFGEHRCHLLAVALRTPGARRAPMQAIADVFTSHGIDPAQPHRS
jgi:hypothetical protein